MSSNTPHPHRRRPSRDNPVDNLSESQLLTRPPARAPQSPNPASPRPNETTSTTTSSPSSPSPETADDPTSTLPLSLSISTLLHSPHLPTDTTSALSHIAATLDPPSHKITVRFHAIGDAPALKQKIAKVGAGSTFAVVVRFLRKRLYGAEGAAGGKGGEGVTGGGGEGNGADGLFCYVNSVFAPGLDEGVGNLWRCFKVNDELIVAYSRTPAFG